MKKRRFLFLAPLLLLCIAAGCAKKAVLPAADVARAALDSQIYTEEMTELSRSRTDALLELSDGDVTEAVLLMDASRSTPEMIAVLTCADSSSAAAAERTLTGYLESLRAQYADYRPEEMPKLEAASVMRFDSQCVLVVAPDQAAARAAVNKAWGK